MWRRKFAMRTGLVGLFIVASTAFAVGGFDRLKDYVKIGQGTTSDKTIEFDVGNGASNPKITVTSAGIISFTGNQGLTPTGSIIAFGGASAPTGWLLADGTAVSRTTYAALFAVVGTSYGAGNGTTTFNLPNLKSRYGIGLDGAGSGNTTLGATGGEAINAHTHSVTSNVSVATQPTFTVDAHTHSVTSNVTVATQPTFTVDPHTHTIAHQHLMDHVHQWADVDFVVSGGMYGISSAAANTTGISNGDTQWLGPNSDVAYTLSPDTVTARKAATYIFTPGSFGLYTTGVLASGGGGTGSSAKTRGSDTANSGIASANTTTRTASVALTNNAVTSGAASSSTTTRTASVALTNAAVTSGAASDTENRGPFVTVNYIVKI